MLKVDYPPEGPYIQVVYCMYDQLGDTQDSAFFGLDRSGWDWVGSNLRDPMCEYIEKCIVHGPRVNAMFAVGLQSFQYSTDPLTILGDRPSKLTADQLQFIYDNSSHWILSGLYAFTQVLRGEFDIVSTPPDSEHGVTHSNIVGKGQVDSLNLVPDIRLSGETEYLNGIPYPALERVDVMAYSGIHWDSVTGVQTGFVWPGFTRFHHTFLDSMINAIIDYGGFMGQTVQDGMTTNFAVSDVVLDHPEEGVTEISYLLHIRRWGMSQGTQRSYVDVTLDRSWRFSVERDLGFVQNWPDSGVSGDHSIIYGLRINSATSVVSTSKHLVEPDIIEYPPAIFAWVDSMVSAPTIPYEKLWGWEGGEIWGVGPKSLHRNISDGIMPESISIKTKAASHRVQLKVHMEKEMGYLLPLSLYSAIDAVAKHIDFTGQNLLETLVEFKQVKGLISPAWNLKSLFRVARSGNLSGTIKAGLDAISDAYLLKQFFIDPSEKQFMHFVKYYDRIVNVLYEKGIWGTKTLYGRYSIDLPSSLFGLSDVVLDYRAKLVVRFDDSSLLTAILCGNATGLFPRLANLWDCLSYSFVIDWFTRESERLNDVDISSVMYLLPINYGVYSIRARRPWDEEFLSDAPHLYTAGGIDSMYYLRWVSGHMPVFRFTKYDAHPIESPLDVVASKAKTMACMGYSLIK